MTRLAIAAAVISVLAPIAGANAADIIGLITDASSAPVVGTQVLVQDLEGKTFASAVTDSSGRYQIHGLEPGTYDLVVRGQSGVAYLSNAGLTVNWGISSDVPPIAIARKGIAEAGASSDRKRTVSPMSVEGK